MKFVKVDEMEKKIKDDLKQDLENMMIKNKIKEEVDKKMAELKTNETATWQDWTTLRVYEASQYGEYEKML